ncbi:MAG: sensor histidine kinase [Anaerolineales bacterium]
MIVRKFFGFLLLFGVTLAALLAALWVAPPFLAQIPPEQILPTTIGLGVIGALLIVLVSLIITMLTSGEEAQPSFDPIRLAADYSQRLTGIADESKLAEATGDLLAQQLKVHRSGWLLMTQNNVAFAAQPVPGQGSFPTAPAELSRANGLIRMLTQKRGPVLHAELDIERMPPAERDWLRTLGAEAYAPVLDAGVLTAVLVVGPRAEGKNYQRNDLDLLALLAALSGPALKTMRATADLNIANVSMAALNESLREKSNAVEKIDNSRSDFLAIASHELRTPITQLLGFADLLGVMADDNTLDRASVKQATDSIVKSCARLNEVINQILDMAQLDSNALQLRFKDTTLEAVLRMAIEPYLSALRERRLNLRLSGLKHMPSIHVDEALRAQALTQLTSNAIKYTPDGGTIDIGVRMLPPEGNLPPSAQITFADGGIGIDTQYQQLIFEKFYRIGSSAQHTTSTTKFMGGGPGLGLSIAKGVIERHGGRLWVESDGHDPEKFPGSRFHVLLPIKPPAFDPRALDSSATTNGGSRETRPLPRTSPFVSP